MARLACALLQQRRPMGDVMWLKENAEFLCVLRATGAEVGPDVLALYHETYASLAQLAGDFPQYYRFFLSMALDLEDLGMPGRVGSVLAQWCHEQRLDLAELSDQQRAEAAALFARRGLGRPDRGLGQRLAGFMGQSRQFAVPNQNAAYALTHLVFYKADYGRRRVNLPPEALQSLHFAGTVAFLAQDADLLAEVALALRFAGQPVPMAWAMWLRAQADMPLQAVPQVPATDGYHSWLVVRWHSAMAEPGRGGVLADVHLPAGAFQFPAPVGQGILAPLTEAIFAAPNRALRGDWPAMRWHLGESLPPSAVALLELAAGACPNFERFFWHFARPSYALGPTDDAGLPKN